MWPFKKKTVEVKEDLSEPVVTLLRIMENEPERFEIDRDSIGYALMIYKCADIATGMEIIFNAWADIYLNPEKPYGDASKIQWMNDSELRAVCSRIEKIYLDREESLRKDQETRRGHIGAAERNRLIGIYCGGES